MKLAAALPGRY